MNRRADLSKMASSQERVALRSSRQGGHCSNNHTTQRNATDAQSFARQFLSQQQQGHCQLDDQAMNSGSHPTSPTKTNQKCLTPQPPPLSPGSVPRKPRELPAHVPLLSTASPYSRPNSARSSGGLSMSGGRLSGSRPNSGALRSRNGSVLTNNATSSTMSSSQNASARNSGTVEWGPSSRVLVPPSLTDGFRDTTVTTPVYSYQARNLVAGQQRIYAVDLVDPTCRVGASITRQRTLFQETPRLYDELRQSEKSLLPNYTVPQWIPERIDWIQKRQEQQDQDDLMTMLDGRVPPDQTTSEPLGEGHAAASGASSIGASASWLRISYLHHNLAVACTVAVQLFIRCALDRRRCSVLRHLRSQRRHQLPQLASDLLDCAARDMQRRYKDQYGDHSLQDGNPATDAVTHWRTSLSPTSSSQSPQRSEALLGDVLESPSSPRRRQLRLQQHIKQGRVIKHVPAEGEEQNQSSSGDGGGHHNGGSHLLLYNQKFGASITLSPSINLPPRPPQQRAGQHAVSKASAQYRLRKASIAQASHMDDSIVKENAAFALHCFFRFAAQRWKFHTRRRELDDYLQEMQLEERVQVVQAFLLSRRTFTVLEFKRRRHRRSGAASVIQRGFRAFRCRVAYLARLDMLRNSHEQRIGLDQRRDACRVLLAVLQGMRARSLVKKRQKLLQLKMRYREETERRQRNQELMGILSTLLSSIVQRVKRATLIAACNEKRVTLERKQERKLRVLESIPLIQTFLAVRKSCFARSVKEQAALQLLQAQRREKQLIVHRVTTDAIVKALSKRVEMVTMSFMDRCPSLWRAKLKRSARDKREISRLREEHIIVVQAFVRARLASLGA
jgi:hypothetical protein